MTAMTVLHWLWDRKWYVLLGLVAIVAMCCGASDWGVELMRAQMDLTDSKAKARALKIERGADNAARAIKANHKETLDDLDVKERAKMDRLSDDPVGLSAELTRIGRRRRRARARSDAPG